MRNFFLMDSSFLLRDTSKRGIPVLYIPLFPLSQNKNEELLSHGFLVFTPRYIEKRNSGFVNSLFPLHRTKMKNFSE